MFSNVTETRIAVLAIRSTMRFFTLMAAAQCIVGALLGANRMLYVAWATLLTLLLAAYGVATLLHHRAMRADARRDAAVSLQK